MVSATMSTNNIKVAIKVRPLIPREKKRHVEEQWTVTENSIVSLNPYQQTTAYHFGESLALYLRATNNFVNFEFHRSCFWEGVEQSRCIRENCAPHCQPKLGGV